MQKLQNRVIRNLGSVVSQMVLGAIFQLLCLDSTKAQNVDCIKLNHGDVMDAFRNSVT